MSPISSANQTTQGCTGTISVPATRGAKRKALEALSRHTAKQCKVDAGRAASSGPTSTTSPRPAVRHGKRRFEEDDEEDEDWLVSKRSRKSPSPKVAGSRRIRVSRDKKKRTSGPIIGMAVRKPFDINAPLTMIEDNEYPSDFHEVTEETYCNCPRDDDCSDDSCTNVKACQECPKDCRAVNCKNKNFAEKKGGKWEVVDTNTGKG